MSVQRDTIRSSIVATIAKIIDSSADDIRDTDALVSDLGIDSLEITNLLVDAERQMKVSIPPGCEGQLATVETVGELVDNLEAILNGTIN